MVMTIILIMMIVASDDGEDGRERGEEKTGIIMVLTIYFKSTSLEKFQDSERKQQQKEHHQSHVFDTHIILTVPQFFVQSLSHILLFVTPWAIALPHFPIHGISQARILGWIIISISRGSSPTRDQTHVSCIGGRFVTTEPPGKPSTVLSDIFNQL